MNVTGFPHSDTAGSKLRGSSPTTIAAMYVLHRQHTPRNPLFALCRRLIPYNHAERDGQAPRGTRTESPFLPVVKVQLSIQYSNLVDPTGLEPVTSSLQMMRSSQLSYGPSKTFDLSRQGPLKQASLTFGFGRVNAYLRINVHQKTELLSSVANFTGPRPLRDLSFCW